jgi:hypothetical protein
LRDHSASIGYRFCHFNQLTFTFSKIRAQGGLNQAAYFSNRLILLSNFR